MDPLVCEHCRTVCGLPPGYQGEQLLCPTCGHALIDEHIDEHGERQPVAAPVEEFPQADPEQPTEADLYPPTQPATASREEFVEDVAEVEVLDESPPPAEGPAASQAAEEISAPRLPGGLCLVAVLLMGLMAVGVGVMVLLVLQQRGGEKGSTGSPLRLERFRIDPPIPGKPPEQWINAEEGSVRLNRTQVEVVWAEFDQARGKDAAGRVIVSDKPYLQILLRIENQSPRPLEYRSWYGNEFDAPGGEVRARLRDNADRAYNWVIFDDVERVRWHRPQAVIEPGKTVEDVIIFELPDDAAPLLVEHVRLELPAAALGGEGFYRFHIPSDMIEGF